MSNNNFNYNIFLNRIYSIKSSIIAYSFASFLDILLILKISSIFEYITQAPLEKNLFFYIFQCFLYIVLRTMFVFILKRFTFNQIFYKKLKDEKNIVENYIKNKVRESENYNLNEFKEKLINSSNLAAINFDIPVCSIVAESIFALGGIMILFNIFGLRLFLFNFPVVILLIIISKVVSKKLNNLGNKILQITEKRLNAIDNVSEVAFELSYLNIPNKLIDYFTKINNPYNKILSNQITSTNLMQIITESVAFIIILLSLISLITNISQTSLANSATSLVVLSRIVPSFTRTISFVTQLQFGVPCVKRLSNI